MHHINSPGLPELYPDGNVPARMKLDPVNCAYAQFEDDVYDLLGHTAEWWFLSLLAPSAAAQARLDDDLEQRLAASKAVTSLQQGAALRAQHAAKVAAREQRARQAILKREATQNRRQAAISARRAELIASLGDCGPEPEPPAKAQALLVPRPVARPHRPTFLQGLSVFQPGDDDTTPVAQPVAARGLMRLRAKD